MSYPKRCAIPQGGVLSEEEREYASYSSTQSNRHFSSNTFADVDACSWSSSDAKGNYVALGFGLESCQTFLQARSNGLDLPYRHWLTGYLTAVNKLTKDTVDIRGTTDSDGIMGLLEHYCIKHRQHSFSRAVEFLVTDLYPQRRTHMPQ
jgi:hypothetical protein